MFGFLQNLFSPRSNPIGIDFGTDTLRLSQVQFDGDDFRLIAAATAPVPVSIRNDIPKRMEFFTQNVTDLLAQGKFRGRRVVLGLPSAWCSVQNFRSTRLDDESLKSRLPAAWATRHGEMQIRHIVAGELKRHDESEWEVIVIAARKTHVDGLLHAALRAKLDVQGMTDEMSAIVDCFTHVYRRKADANSTTCYLDIGSQGSRVVIARGGRIAFMKNTAIGGDELNSAVAARLKIQPDDARLLRQKLSHAETESADRPPRAADDTASKTTDQPAAVEREAEVAARVEKSLGGPLYALVQELSSCRRDHDAIFPGAPVDRLVLCGGEARNRLVCKYISSAVRLATQVGDPMVRLSKSAQNSSAIDRRQPQPMWCISLGLTMGPIQSTGELPRSLLAAVPSLVTREAA